VTAETTLRSVTVAVDDDVDLLAHLDREGATWVHDDRRLVTSGVAARVPAARAVELLSAIDADDPLALPGTGPIALGALGFDPEHHDELVVPATVLGRAHGVTWRTDIGPSRPLDGHRGQDPARFSVAATQPRPEWDDKVRAALAAIADGRIDKVVLAREVLVESDVEFDVAAIARRLVDQQPGCFVYALDGLVGASPELLVRRTGRQVESRPMAGTTVAHDADALDALARSTKDNHEHRLVIDAIASVLGAACEHLDVAARPHVAVFAAMAHLTTPLRGTLRAVDGAVPDALALARSLHPTPAVGGTPTAAALALIRELEGFDRGRYAGPVGWVDSRGDGEWAIALRGADVDGRRARLVAGAGIVAGSEPDSEWRETQAKLEPMLRALVRP
jgi:menaquinone-specific isochorismate synthase